MTSNAAVRKISSQIRRMNRRLRETDAEASNADLALWGALAIAHLNGGVASGKASAGDTELALSDLLADLMHWCDLRASKTEDQPILFDTALERAREYYQEERDRRYDR